MRDISSYPDAHLRQFERPPVPPPEEIEHVFFIGICGTGMGALAGLLKEAGYTVSGSDESIYPPMSTHLKSLNIPILEGYSKDHLKPHPDLVVVGNACRPTHPEATYARENGLVQQSFPEALAHFFLNNRRSLVVGGTHGKTTTTALLVHLLESAEKHPGYLIGGVPQKNERTYAVGNGPHFVVEGDEYDSAYFDKQPKFLHYQPSSAIVTSMELDHLDIYEGWDDYKQAFQQFVSELQPEGLLAVHGDNPTVRTLGRETDARVWTYGFNSHQNDIAAINLDVTENGQTFTLVTGGQHLVDVELPMYGRYNVLNALAACALALDEGLSPEQVRTGLKSFAGVKRRQEIRGEVNDIVVVDDFAHHPTAVAATLQAAHDRWPDRRIVAVFEPRTNSSRRKAFETRYGETLSTADRVFLSVPPFRHNDHPDRFIDTDALQEMISSTGTDCSVYADADELLDPLTDNLKSGDIVLIMSNGGFGNIHQRLLDRLRERHEPADAEHD